MKAIISTIFILLTSITSHIMAQDSPVQRKDLMQPPLVQSLSKVEMQEITMAPGVGAPTHLHPCPVIGWVKEGSILFQIDGQEAVILHEGDTFYEPKNAKVLHFDNASKETPSTFIAIYLKVGEEANIKILK